jgi:L-asparaginase
MALARSILVLTTGGTIASRDDGTGAKVATTEGRELLEGSEIAPDLDVRVREVLSTDSSALTLADLDTIRAAVLDALTEDVVGVVLTHGTDTLEETALLLDLCHDDPRPVVLTGAVRSADDVQPDGPRNLRDALAVAASPTARGLGVLVVLGGSAHAARGTRKLHTTALTPFHDPRWGAVGLVTGAGLDVVRTPERPAALAPAPLGRVRVDVVALYPGVDATALDAHVAAGARGLVLEATGSGNTHPEVVTAVARHVRAGITVLVSTRVHAGEVAAVYGGGGGGRDLLDAGAVLVPWLRPGQARIQLLALLSAGATEDQVRGASW